MAKQVTVHESFQRTEEIEGSSNRGFGLLFVCALALVSGYSVWVGSGRSIFWALATALVAAVTWLIPASLAPLNKLWTRLALLLSRLMTPVVMALLYFGTVLPTGLLIRLLAKDSMRLQWRKDVKSYWIDRDPPGPAAQSLKKQF